jgi:hypothetical protein
LELKLKDNETRIETVEEFQKSQVVRLVDVFVIAPICVYAGVKYYKTMPKWLSLSLIGIGLATAVYNGRNYAINRKNNDSNLIEK